jgi:hypothetical protein
MFSLSFQLGAIALQRMAGTPIFDSIKEADAGDQADEQKEPDLTESEKNRALA